MRSLLASFASFTLVLSSAACGKSTPPTPPDGAPAATSSGLGSVGTGAGTGANPNPAVAKKPSDLAAGDPAPAVTFTLQDGKKTTLASLAGKDVAIYFYPKDETAGCTIEAQGIRDNYAALQQAGVVVIGVSTQDADSHKAFIAKEKLPFDLAVDADESVAKAFGVPVRAGYTARQTFLVGKDGKLKKVWREVKPQGHAEEILNAAKS